MTDTTPVPRGESREEFEADRKGQTGQDLAMRNTPNKAAESRGFAQGIAVACGIIQSCFDQPTMCAEVLNACHYETRQKLKAAGADDYDLKLLKPVFREIKNRSGR